MHFVNRYWSCVYSSTLRMHVYVGILGYPIEWHSMHMEGEMIITCEVPNVYKDYA